MFVQRVEIDMLDEKQLRTNDGVIVFAPAQFRHPALVEQLFEAFGCVNNRE